MSRHERVIGKEPVDEISVDRYTRGLIGPDVQWDGPIRDGGTIAAELAPGCFGPMITPEFRGGHEVTRPVAVEGAEVGDAIALKIERVEVTSSATSTGTHEVRSDAYEEDPSVDHTCPGCGTRWPESSVDGIGEDAIRCAECGENASSYEFEFGYTTVFDDDREIGVTVPDEAAATLAERAEQAMALPDHSDQHPALLYKPSEMPGTIGRLRPFIGNIGTTPPIEMPDSRNAGDLGQFLIGADHPWGLPDEEALEQRTDAHMDINEVRAGAILVCPVKVRGGGIYLGDIHANQGDGELASHATDVSGLVEIEIEVIEGLCLDGPLLLPNASDLPDIAQPYSAGELEKARTIAKRYDTEVVDDTAPIQVVGSGQTVNDATDNAFGRASDLLDMSVGEIRTRSTYTGGVKIGRLPGMVQLSLLAPIETLDEQGIGHLAREQYAV